MASSVASRFEAEAETIRALLAKSGVRLAYLFGSAARGVERADSDLDVAVLLDRDTRFERRRALQLELTTELVGLTHTNDVDVVILNEVPPHFAYQVIAAGRCFFGERPEQVRFEVRTIQRYIDTQPLRDYAAKGFLERRPRETPVRTREPSRW